ncbi:hypothetical protein [Streptomyces viridochromogenes]|uniref:hypothetical protein n=1 Tax=Streptomyces viridochromogenes TaxID=1938 RepID=UPI00069F0888|nr:hypothetical protein [Streptomyces viridochromogenes]
MHKAAADGLPTLADKGYIGAGIGIRVPVRRPKGTLEQARDTDTDTDTRTTNCLFRDLRALGERTAAELEESRRTLKRVTLSPTRIGGTARAALALNRHWKCSSLRNPHRVEVPHPNKRHNATDDLVIAHLTAPHLAAILMWIRR